MNPSHYPQLMVRNPNGIHVQEDGPNDKKHLTTSSIFKSKTKLSRRKERSKSDIYQSPEERHLIVEDDRLSHSLNYDSTITSELNDMANIETVVEHSINHRSDDRHELTGQEKPDFFKRQSSYYTPNMEDKFRRKLKFFFMDPCSKWKAKRRWPWKLCLQILKIFLITAQVVIFANQRSGTVDYFERNKLALKHIFLKDWEASYETMPYPPAVGQYAVYTRNEFIAHINNIMKQYYQIPTVAIGTFYWEKSHGNDSLTAPPPITMCKKSYKEVTIFQNQSFIINPQVITECFPIQPVNTTNGTAYNIVEYLNQINKTIYFDRLLKIELLMKFRSYHLDLLTRHTGPACFKTNVNVMFDSSQRDGQMLVDLLTQITEADCDGKILSEDVEAEEMHLRNQLTAYDSFVIVVVTISAFLCLRSIYTAQKLRKEAVVFFNNRYGKQLTFSDKMEFLNLWYVLIVINDMLTLAGSCFKIMIENKKFSSLSENYDLCSILLGVGSLMAWCGVLRYLGFFNKYNILIITLKTAFPNVLRFMVCALILYLGFMFCGWVILGPYHIKFRHLHTSSECLFSLVNGDDMFVTFSATETTNDVVWYFSRIYLYIFISLFIYIVLSLFIAVIMDTYETLKYYWEYGFPKSDLFMFIEECNDLPSSGRFDDRKKGCSLFACLPCCKREDHETPNEKTSLIKNYN